MEARTDPPPTLTRFDPIEINYERSMEELTQAGKYDHVNPNLTSENFPTEKSGKVRRVPVEVHYNRYINSYDAVADMKARKLDPADEREGLTFGEKYPEEQAKHSIVCLGKKVRLKDDRHILRRHVLVLSRLIHERWASLEPSNDVWMDEWSEWGDDCRFLAFEQIPIP